MAMAIEQKQLPNDTKILIVGLGLIGGSYAMALHRKGYHVEAIDCSDDTIDFALAHDYIDIGYTEPDPEAIGRADLIILSLYPHILLDWVRENQKAFRPGVIVTDVTGVKCGVVEPVQEMLRPDAEFIAAHPMAGRERYGVQNSDDRIFFGANYIVVPTEKNTAHAISVCRELAETLGFARITELSTEDHDRMIGFVSTADALHRDKPDDLLGQHTSVRLHGRLLPRPHAHSANKRGYVERAVPCQSRRTASRDGCLYRRNIGAARADDDAATAKS